MKKAALYIRVSTTHQIDKDSLPFQRNELMNYSKFALGIDDYEIFEDAGYSGKNTDRPKYQEMMTRCKSGEFTHILVWKIDRISRNLKDFTEMYEDLKDYGIAFISKNEQFDTSSAMGEAMLKIILVFAELERKLTAERVYSIMLSRAEKGLWNGANCPLGFKWNEDKKFPTICPEESETIKLIYDTYEKTQSSFQVMKMLNTNGIKTKRGGTWTSKTVVDIIRNPFYNGTYRYNYKQGGRGKKKAESEWIILENNHDAIINMGQWELCNEIMDSNAERNTSAFRSNSNVHVFAGLVKCGECGKNFIANLDRPRADGFVPSRFRCATVARALGCNARMVSDVMIGPFVLNYLANLLRSRINSDASYTLASFKSDMLYGDEFEGITDIIGIDDTFKALDTSNSLGDLLADDSKSKKTDTKSIKLNKEKEKFKRAIDRLQDLYLFSEDAMSESAFLIKKHELTEKLAAIDKEIKSIKVTDNPFEKLSFLGKVNMILVSNEISIDDHVIYKDLVANSEKIDIKNFVNAIISEIVILDRKVVELSFKNGFTHKFVYGDE